ncbi:TIGR03862 family flavoprotein, partial [Rhodovulum sp.]|uniref:TIGR03862 family flavoprotein n=1 Tax=Rhodovulum sp. TaxID=34009 RepID=UPI0018511AAB
MERIGALVIGAGPAGLMAAEALGAAGIPTVIAEAKAAPARKFLMAGKSGLNLTRAEPSGSFLAAYAEAAGPLGPMIAAFGPEDVCAWAEGLGQPVFTGSTGRVFPTAMKASPLLRAWLRRLEGFGVTLRPRWRWTGWDGAAVTFDTPEGPRAVLAGVTILALGGASWARLGSDGAWVGPLSAAGVPVAPFAPANVGLRVDWSAPMARQFGQPVKG